MLGRYHIVLGLANAATYYQLYIFVEDKDNMIALYPDHSQFTFSVLKWRGEASEISSRTYGDIG